MASPIASLGFKHLKNKESVGLAPMEGVTDFPARLWFSQTSAPAFMGTPFLRVTNTFPGKIPATFAPELNAPYNQVSYELIPQIMTADADDFNRIGEKLLKFSPIVDLNCGCPSPRCRKGGAGSSLLLDPDVLGRFGETITQRLGPDRVSIKMRLGFESVSEFPELIDVLTKLPLHHLSIHGRTRSEKYQGLANWQPMHLAQSKANFPIMGSGDIVCSDSLAERVEGSIGKAIIGRGALHNPWIFEELRRGVSLEISPLTLKYSLACFSLLNHLSNHSLDKLLALVADGAFLEAALEDEDKWRALFARLAQAAGRRHAHPEDLGTDRANLGRTKMVWAYMRPGLPEAYQARGTLRSRSYSEFFSHTAGWEHSTKRKADYVRPHCSIQIQSRDQQGRNLSP